MKRFLSASPTPSLIEDASPKGAGKSLAASALIHVGILAGIAAILTVSPLQKTESAGNQVLQIDLGPGGWASDTENHIAKGVASGTNDGKSVTEPKKGSEAVKKAPAPEHTVPVPKAVTPAKPTPAPKPEPAPSPVPAPEPMKAAPKPADTAAVATPAKPSVAKSSSQTPGSASGTAAGEGKSSAHLGAAIGTGNGKTTLAGSGNQLKSLAGGGGDAAFADNGDGTYRITGKGKLDIVILNDAHPVYPRRARVAGYSISIRVRVRFVVDEKGDVIRSKVMTSDIPPLDFEQAALKAIRAMKFRPIKRLGVPVKVTFEKAIIFRP